MVPSGPSDLSPRLGCGSEAEADVRAEPEVGIGEINDIECPLVPGIQANEKAARPPKALSRLEAESTLAAGKREGALMQPDCPPAEPAATEKLTR